MRLHTNLPNEKTVLIIRKHWFIFLIALFRDSILLLVPLPVIWFLNTTFPGFADGLIIYPVYILSLSSYYLLILLFSFIKFIDLYLDVWVVTTKCVVGIEQKGMFSRIESEHRFDRIQDITIEVHGPIATVLDYGDIHVQTAGENVRFLFLKAPSPYALKKELSKLIEASREGV